MKVKFLWQGYLISHYDQSHGHVVDEGISLHGGLLALLYVPGNKQTIKR